MPSWELDGIEDLDQPLTVQELRDYTNVTLGSAEGLLTGALNGAFGRCQRYTKRQLTPHPASGSSDEITVTRRSRIPRRIFRIPDARSASLVVADGVVVPPETDLGYGATGYLLEGHPDPDADPAPTIELPTHAQVVSVTGTFGFDPFPDDLRDSVIKFAARGYREAKAQYGDHIEQPEGGMVSYFRQVPAAVKLTWDQYWFQIPLQVA